MFAINSKILSRSFARRPWIWLLGVCLLTAPCGYLAARLRIQSDFKYLLPEDKPSVVELNRIVERVGGIGTLLVGIECDDFRATERFIEDLVPRLRSLPQNYVRYVEYNVSGVRSFFTDNKYLYVDLEDLKSIHDRLAKKIRYEKLRQNPFYIALDEDRAEFDLSDIEEKYRSKSDKYDYKDGYFFSEDLKLAAVVIKPYGTATGTAFAKELIQRVQGVVDELEPGRYHSSMEVRFAGKFSKVLAEYDQLMLDVIGTLALCLLLVAALLYLYFLRVRAIWLLALPLLAGAAWTFALTELHIGFLNSQTAFLGSIIVGNGVNYGIMLLARYLEERRAGRQLEEALHTAIRQTWLGTLTAATTTSAGFAALAISEIKGFSHFGFIGGCGMTLCWLATYLMLPPLLVVTERIWPMVGGRRFVSRQWAFLLRPVSSLVSFSPRIVAALGILLAALAVAGALTFLPESLEYDFSKLRNKPGGKADLRDFWRRVDDIFKQDTSPVVMLLNDEDQARNLCPVVMKLEEEYREADKNIDDCKTLHSYLPDRQAEKLGVLKKIRKLLADSSLNFVKPEYRREIDEFRAAVDLKEITLPMLPDQIRRNFEERDGRLGRIAYVFPRRSANLSDGKRLIQFADELSAVRLSDGSVVRMSGEAAIFADLLRAVIRDGPVAMALSFLLVGLAVALNFRRFWPVTFVVGGLVLGMIYMFGVQSLFQVKLNFFNFIALPVTLGIGVDYGVNLLQRYRFEGRGSTRRVLLSIGGAILLCSLTTLVSYATLLTATNQALASFGLLALVGEIACLGAATFVMPAVLQAYDRKIRPEKELVA